MIQPVTYLIIMAQQALSNAFVRSFPGIQTNSSEAANIQDGSKTTNFIEKAESKGKFDEHVFNVQGWQKLLIFG